MKTETIEGNKLIAEFKCTKSFDTYYDSEGEYHFELHEAKYHSSWDWLMPVVEKIERLGYQSHINFGSLNNTFSQHTFYNECSFQYINKNTFEDGVLLYKAADTKIKSVWLAVVEFIKWYNQNNNQ